MTSNQMILTHPVDDLRFNDLGSSALDMANPPPLFLVRGSAQTEYMPAITAINLVDKVRFQRLGKGQYKFFCPLSRAANQIWLQFFVRYHLGADATLQGNTVIVHCRIRVPPSHYARLCEDTIYKATHDYWVERGSLLWHVFIKMRELQQRNYWEGQVQTELANFQRECREAGIACENEDGAVPRTVWNKLSWHYRSVLEVKFGWWNRVLDAATIRRYRAAFSLAPFSM